MPSAQQHHPRPAAHPPRLAAVPTHQLRPNNRGRRRCPTTPARRVGGELMERRSSAAFRSMRAGGGGRTAHAHTCEQVAARSPSPPSRVPSRQHSAGQQQGSQRQAQAVTAQPPVMMAPCCSRPETSDQQWRRIHLRRRRGGAALPSTTQPLCPTSLPIAAIAATLCSVLVPGAPNIAGFCRSLSAMEQHCSSSAPPCSASSCCRHELQPGPQGDCDGMASQPRS